MSRVGLPLIVYHHPGRTGIQLSTDLLTQLSALPNIVGIKDSSGETTITESVLARSNTTILSGDDLHTYSLMEKGAKGTISVIGNLIPGPWSDFVNAFFKKRFRVLKKDFSKVS